MLGIYSPKCTCLFVPVSIRESTFSLINQASCGVYKCQKQFASLWYLPASGVLYEIGNCSSFHSARHTKHFLTREHVHMTLQNSVFLSMCYRYSLPTLINFSPENRGCCEHDLQFHRINVFIAVVSPVKLQYAAKSKQLWVQGMES